MAGRWARLAAIFFLVGLATSRISLVLHELVGHGGAATLVGASVVDHRLFLFGGGWISYEWGAERGAAAALIVSLAGIAIEIAVAALALLVARSVRAPIARVGLVGLAAANLVHAGFYLAAGTHHGFGDGRMLHAALGSARGALVWPACAAVVVAGLLLARRLARLAGDWVGARSQAGRAAALVSAVAVATLGHGALTLAERRVIRDEAYGRIMKREGERRVDREVARLAEAARKRGAPLDTRELDAMRAELARRQREFPLVPVLAGALVLACGLGVWLGVGSRRARSREGPAPPTGEGPATREGPAPPTGDGFTADEPTSGLPRWPDILPLAAAASAALGLVALIRLFE
jgi:hypothetical protein